jgi:hypothetical protein
VRQLPSGTPLHGQFCRHGRCDQVHFHLPTLQYAPERSRRYASWSTRCWCGRTARRALRDGGKHLCRLPPGRGCDNHLFQPQLAKCQECHADAESLDVNGAQTREREWELKAALWGLALWSRRRSHPRTWDEAQATALWNYGVIEEDVSRGVTTRTMPKLCWMQPCSIRPVIFGLTE